VNAVTEVSDRVSNLVREEIELAKAEVTIKARSILRGTAAVLAGAVFGVVSFIATWIGFRRQVDASAYARRRFRLTDCGD